MRFFFAPNFVDTLLTRVQFAEQKMFKIWTLFVCAHLRPKNYLTCVLLSFYVLYFLHLERARFYNILYFFCFECFEFFLLVLMLTYFYSSILEAF